MIDQQLVNIILNEIAELEKEYQFSQGMILTEDDLKCHLFARLRPLIPQAEPTMNANVFGSSLHAEVNFFDEHDKLTLRPDICVIDPSNMSIFNSVEFEVKRGQFADYSHKCFEIGGSAILIELKFCRSENGVGDNDISEFQADLDKLERLNRIVSLRSNGIDRIFGIFAIFNKTDIGKAKVVALKLRHVDFKDLHIFYGTGKVDFTGINPELYGSGYQTETKHIS